MSRRAGREAAELAEDNSTSRSAPARAKASGGAGGGDGGDKSIFSLERDDTWRVPGMRIGNVRLVASGGGTCVIATSDVQVLVWTPREDGAARVVELKNARPEVSRVHHVAVDPAGQHVLVCLVSAGSGATYYCQPAAGAARLQGRELPGLRGQIIDSVAWAPGGASGGGSGGSSRANAQAAAAVSAHMLLGTNAGRILECRIEDGKEKSITRLWETSAAGGDALPLVSLLWAEGTSAAASKYCILAATARPLRYYQFSGGPTLEAVFAPSNSGAMMFRELRGGPDASLGPELRLTLKEGSLRPEALAMLTGVGLYTARVTVNSYNEITATDPKLLPYPRVAGGGGDGAEGEDDSRDPNASNIPISLALTPFHFVLLYRNRLLAVSRISGDVVFEQALTEERFGSMRSLVVDSSPREGSGAPVLVFSDRFIFHVIVRDEARDVWRLHLARKDFEAARRYCRGSASALEQVNEAEAEHMLNTGAAEAAARAFARTNKPFEETCLRFIEGGQRSALHTYLQLRLESLGTDKAQAPQRAILAMWLLESHLDKLNTLYGPAITDGGAASAAYDAAQLDFQRFVSTHQSDLDRPTALALMAGHGRMEELLYYCRLTGDWARVVAHHVNQNEWQEALDAIRDAPESGSDGGSAADDPLNYQEDLWYKYSATLLPVLPAAVLDGWKACRGLDPVKLLPTLVRYQQVRATSAALAKSAASASLGALPSAVLPVAMPPLQLDTASSPDAVAQSLNAAMIYLEWVVRTGAVARAAPAPAQGTTPHQARSEARGRQRAVHNTLLAIYAQQEADSLLLDYIEEHTSHLRAARPAGAAVAAGGSDGTANPAVAMALAERERQRLEELGEEEDDTAPPFDIAFALRVCVAEGQKAACVRLYWLLGLYVEALDLALTVSVDLAKAAANAPPKEEAELRKRLWTRIAVHVIARGGGAQGAIDVLRESGVLRIEDVLSYFPGATTLGDFKTEVTESLKEADTAIAALRAEMRDFTQAAERVRADIKALRNRCGTLRVNQRCELCRTPALSRHFYLFPCTHAFHSDCLLADMMRKRYLTPLQKKRVAETTQNLQRAQALAQAVADAGAAALAAPAVAAEVSALGLPIDSRSSAPEAQSAITSRLEELQADLDRYIASECMYCGDAMIDTIAEPLGSDGDDEGHGHSHSNGDEWDI